MAPKRKAADVQAAPKPKRARKGTTEPQNEATQTNEANNVTGNSSTRPKKPRAKRANASNTTARKRQTTRKNTRNQAQTPTPQNADSGNNKYKDVEVIDFGNIIVDHGEEDETVGEGTEGVHYEEEAEYGPTASNAEDDNTDEYVPEGDEECDINENEEGDAEAEGKPQEAEPSNSGLSRAEILRAKRDRQNEFIILTRDNNKPDPYGTHSTTTGQLGFKQVGEKYVERFGGSGNAAAMEKRYRTNMDRFCLLHPNYPRDKIIYATDSTDAARAGKKNDQEEENDEANEENDEGLEGNTPGGEGRDSEGRAKHGGFNPPDDVRNDADIYNYFNSARPGPKSKKSKWVILTITSRTEDVKERIRVPVEHIRSSSARVKKMLRNADGTLELFLKRRLDIVEKYVQIISPKVLHSLPEYWFTMELFRGSGGTLRYKAVTYPIKWKFRDLVDLYTLATYLDDSYVRTLVLRRWDRIEIPGVLEDVTTISANDIHALYEEVGVHDPARRKWEDIIRQTGRTLESKKGQHGGFKNHRFTKISDLNKDSQELANLISRIQRYADDHYIWKEDKRTWYPTVEPVDYDESYLNLVAHRLFQTEINTERIEKQQGITRIKRASEIRIAAALQQDLERIENGGDSLDPPLEEPPHTIEEAEEDADAFVIEYLSDDQIIAEQ